MAWGQFNPDCPCCNKDTCLSVFYPWGLFGGNPSIEKLRRREREAAFYYSLNKTSADNEWLNPITQLPIRIYNGNLEYNACKILNNQFVIGESDGNIIRMENPEDIDLIFMDCFSICKWYPPLFGYIELLKFLDRGKTIAVTAEWRGCILNYVFEAGATSLSTVRAILTGLESTMDIVLDNIYYGCQTITNEAPHYNINEGWKTFPVGGSSSISVGNGFPLVTGINNTRVIMAGENVRNGKVLLLGDANMLDCNSYAVPAIRNNVCKYQGQPIEPLDWN